MDRFWIFVVLFPRKISAKSAKVGSRLLLALSGCRARIKGLENLDPGKPLIIVANHASYLDSIVLTAFLPTSFIYVGKKELLEIPVMRTFLKRLHFLTVDRINFSKNVSDIERMATALRNHYSIVIFPEGILTANPGLCPFKSGAFKLAVETNTPVCPVAIQGTRSILRDDNFLLKWGRITVHVGKPILPKAKDWHEIGRISDLSRNEIAKHCGEQLIKL